jgi:aminodeoxyfutalosine deaminase
MLFSTYLERVPKAELHIHLEGSILPATLLRIARRNKVDLPVSTVAEMQEWFTYRDFAHFIEIYMTITHCLKTAIDYEEITYEFGAEMARQHVLYAEVTFTPSTHEWMGVPHDTYFSGLTRGRERARRDFGVEIAWIFDIVRNSSTQLEQRANYAVDVAIEGISDGVVALGLGGMEAGYPPEPFAPYFQRARSAGLHSSPHAGELSGPESIWGAIHHLGAERIGHGVRAIEDPTLIAYLVEHHIALEVNPTSNICLGVYPDMAAHPLRRLIESGVLVVLGSDDPPLFNTTLNDEYQLAVSAFGLEHSSIKQLILNGVQASFLSPKRKEELLEVFAREGV